MRGLPWAALLAMLACSAWAAGGPLELRLRGGETMRVSEAELRDGSWHVRLPSGIALTLPEDKVLELRELDAEAARGSSRVSGLNYGTDSADRPVSPTVQPTSEHDRALLSSVQVLQAQRRLAEAESLLRDELISRPGDPLRLVLLGQTLVQADRFNEALQPLRLAAPPKGSDLMRARDLGLAEAYSRLDRMDEALRALDSTPEDGLGSVAAARSRIERDREGSAGLERVETLRFSLHLPEGTGRLDTRPLMEHLDAAWDELESQLGGAPRERVVVVIYAGDAFWETTGMGGSVGGLYDGKVRVPSGSLSPPSVRLGAVLRHELAHAFVDALTGGRADSVWQEGIAEHFEGSRLMPALERRLVQAHQRGTWPPRYDHATAHSRLDWFLGRWSMAALRDLLSEWSRRGSIDEALNAVVGMDETELERAWVLALAEKWEP